MPNLHQRPFSIKVFVPNGDPDGLRLVEKSNWTGVGVVFKRTNFRQVIQRPEFERTGVYVLVGTTEDSSLPIVYIGEGDPVKERLNQHYSKKDFWEWAVFFVTKDSSLNKAHVKHLESRLLERAHASKQCKVDNAQPSLQPSLSEAETADVESFLLDMLSIFPLLGLNVFERTETKEQYDNLLHLNTKNIRATGYEDAKGFVISKGSQAVKEELPSIHPYMSTLRKDLLVQGVLQDSGAYFTFTQDYVFNSPSTAAGTILGRPSNGRIEWKNKNGKTLKDLQSLTAQRTANTDEIT